MINTNEALTRIAVAEFEARRLKERSEKQARRWRLALTALRVVVALGIGAYLPLTHLEISGAQVCGFFLLYLALSAVAEHRTGELVRSLQAELDQLKNEIEAKSH